MDRPRIELPEENRAPTGPVRMDIQELLFMLFGITCRQAKEDTELLLAGGIPEERLLLHVHLHGNPYMVINHEEDCPALDPEKVAAAKERLRELFNAEDS